MIRLHGWRSWSVSAKIVRTKIDFFFSLVWVSDFNDMFSISMIQCGSLWVLWDDQIPIL